MKRNKGLVIVICISIALIVIINAICVLVACCPELVNELFNVKIGIQMNGADRVESSIISTGLTIIGIAVAVWTGLNIANTIDKKRIDEIDDKIDAEDKRLRDLLDTAKVNLENQTAKLGEKINSIEEMRKAQDGADKSKLLQEMYATLSDIATKELIKKIIDIPEESGVEFIKLLPIEQDFRSVYELHHSKYTDNQNLRKAAQHGIHIATAVLLNTKEENARLYLNFRIAEFQFYQGYCYIGEDRLSLFLDAIKRYHDCKNGFNAAVPDFKEFESENGKINIDFSPVQDDAIVISAYFCNTIGEAYSKIEQNRKELIEGGHSKEELDSYGKRAIYYCAHANHWKNMSLYKRNLGCAIERMYGTRSHSNILTNLYNDALKLDPSNVNNFKVTLSLKDKYVNNILHINFISPEAKREPALCSKEFASIWASLPQESKHDIQSNLANINTVSSLAKAIHSSKEVGYQYACIYFRDMCAIYGNHTLEIDENKVSEMRKIAKVYYEKSEENLKVLEIIAPNNPMTKILRNDLDDLKNLL